MPNNPRFTIAPIPDVVIADRFSAATSLRSTGARLASGFVASACGALTAIALAVALTGPALAAEPGAAAAVYGLAPGDRINIMIFDQPELSGDFYIDGSGNLRMAMIGDIPVGDMNVKEVEQQITKKLGNGFLQNPVVSVRVSEFRPIFVSGDVKTPGSYPFRYGTMAMSAVALAGGYAATEQLQGAARVEFLMADERVRVLEDSRRVLKVRITRLEAQLADAATFDIPDAAGLEALVARERAALTNEISHREREIALLREQQPRLQAQIVRVEQERDAETTQLTLIQKHLEDYNSLLSSGLARRYTGIELHREEARNRGNIAGFEAQALNLQLAIGEIEVRIQQAETNYTQRVAAELQEASSKLREIETTIPIAKEIRDTRLQQGGFQVARANANPTYRIVIMRHRRNELQTIEADETTLVEPGDLVEVKKSGMDDQPGPMATLKPATNPHATSSADSAMTVSPSTR